MLLSEKPDSSSLTEKVGKSAVHFLTVIYSEVCDIRSEPGVDIIFPPPAWISCPSTPISPSVWGRCVMVKSICPSHPPRFLVSCDVQRPETHTCTGRKRGMLVCWRTISESLTFHHVAGELIKPFGFMRNDPSGPYVRYQKAESCSVFAALSSSEERGTSKGWQNPSGTLTFIPNAAVNGRLKLNMKVLHLNLF